MKQIRNECNKAELVFQLDSRYYLPGWQQRQGLVLHSQSSGWLQSVFLQQYLSDDPPDCVITQQSHPPLSLSLSTSGVSLTIPCSSSTLVPSSWQRCVKDISSPQLLHGWLLLWETQWGEIWEVIHHAISQEILQLPCASFQCEFSDHF